MHLQPETATRKQPWASGRDRRGCGEAAERRFRGMAGTALKRLMAEYKRESGGVRVPVLFPTAARGVTRRGSARCGAVRAGLREPACG